MERYRVKEDIVYVEEDVKYSAGSLMRKSDFEKKYFIYIKKGTVVEKMKENGEYVYNDRQGRDIPKEFIEKVK